MKRYKVIQNGTKGISTDFFGMTFRITISQFPTLDHLIITSWNALFYTVEIPQALESSHALKFHRFDFLDLSTTGSKTPRI